MTITYLTAETVWTGVAGDAPHGIVLDDAGNVWTALQGGGRIVKLQPVLGEDAMVSLVERATFEDAQHPTELAFDGVFVVATHSYMDGLPVLSDTVSLIAVASAEVKQVVLGAYNSTYDEVVPMPVVYGPGSIALSRDHVWLSCAPFMMSGVDGFTGVMPLRLNPTSGACSPGLPFQEFADQIYSVAGGVPELTYGPITLDVTGAVYLSFRLADQWTIRATTVSKALETDALAIRSFGPSGAILATTPSRSSSFSSDASARGAVYPLVGENVGDTVVWSVDQQRWLVGPGGGGGFIADGDLDGSSVSQEVVGVRTVPVRVGAQLPTADYEVLMIRTGGVEPFEYELARLTEDMILPAFAVTSFTSGTGPLLEVGDDIDPGPISFTATYNQSAPYDAVTLWDSDNTTEDDVSATPNAFDSPYTFVGKMTYGDAVVFRVSATKDGFLKTRNYTVTWARRAYWFAAASPGAFPALFTQVWVEGNDAGTLTTTKNRTFTVDAGVFGDNKHIYYLYRDAYPASQFWVNGFQGGFTKLGTINLTTPGGATEAYAVYESNQVGLGVTQVTVTD